MITKNIKFTNFVKFNTKKNKIPKKKIILKNFIKKYPLLLSLKREYKYSYSKKTIRKLKSYPSINIIGMGGSILGIKAIYGFLNYKINKKVSFIDNLLIKKPKKIVKNNLNIIISKSGETLETICNSNLIIKKNKKNRNIFITEKKDNYLNLLANKLKCEVFEHKNYIGGRYSVLSEVGMLPAELMGLDEQKFKRYNYLIKNKKFINALIENVKNIYFLSKIGKKNSIMLNYDEFSEDLMKWYQQLVGESLGKRGKGLTPILSPMPKDSHSLLQLYLDGPKNNFFTFFSVNERTSEKLSNDLILEDYFYLKNKKLNFILHSQKKALEHVFIKKKIPFRSFDIKNRSEETIGELFTFFILETILLGNFLRLNPFDQPAVNEIKIETKKILNS